MLLFLANVDQNVLSIRTEHAGAQGPGGQNEFKSLNALTRSASQGPNEWPALLDTCVALPQCWRDV
jgi:hypothetical protein